MFISRFLTDSIDISYPAITIPDPLPYQILYLGLLLPIRPPARAPQLLLVLLRPIISSTRTPAASSIRTAAVTSSTRTTATSQMQTMPGIRFNRTISRDIRTEEFKSLMAETNSNKVRKRMASCILTLVSLKIAKYTPKGWI